MTWDGGQIALAGLLAAHATAAATIAVFASRSIGPHWLEKFSFDVLPSLFLSQLGLLGIWLGLSRTRITRRLLMALLGMVYLQTLIVSFVWPVPLIGRFFLVVLTLIPFLGVAALMGLIRWRGCQVVLADNQSIDRRPLYFSIRNLLILTSLIALLFAIKQDVGRGLMAYIMYASRFSATLLCQICVFAGSVWAALTVGRTGLKVGTVIVFASLTGALRAYYYMGYGDAGKYLLRESAFTCGEAIVVVGSLLVVRALGYRLVGKRDCHAPLESRH